MEDTLKVAGWDKSRRVVILRGPAKPDVALARKAAEGQMELLLPDQDVELWEYAVLVTNSSYPITGVYGEQHKFTLQQQWTVRVKPEQVAEILDVAVTAGATVGGQIDWTVEDEHALEDKALDGAAARARAQAEVLAKGMGVKLGALIHVSKQISATVAPIRAYDLSAARAAIAPPPPLAIEPNKAERTAIVYAVFAIE